MTQSPDELGDGHSPSICLDGRFDILPGIAAGHPYAPGAVFEATERDRTAEPYFALICDPALPPRHDILGPLSALHVDDVVTPRAWGVVDWTPLGRRCFVIIYPRPGGGMVADSLADSIVAVSEDDVLNAVLPSMVSAFKVLFTLGITHRSVRPTNLFRRAIDGRIVLGECVSGPPAYRQPIAYEPIESALAQPEGRGPGVPADDLYALGATLIFLLLGRDPTHGMDAAKILAEKMNRGSFVTLLGGARLPLRMLEPIRGLLADDPRERWTLADLDGWVQKRRLSLKQFAPHKRAARPLEVAGTGYVTARSLAHGFAIDPAAAAKCVKAGDFDAWLQRSLGDAERIAAVTVALGDAGFDGQTHEPRLVSRICMALDPRGPVRYAGLSAAVDGFGPLLANAYLAGSGAPAIADAFMARLPQFWFTIQQSTKSEHAPQLKTLDRQRKLLEDRRPGFGLERLLYELNPGLQCISPAIEHDYVNEPGRLLEALERASAGGRLGENLIDRHVAAFIAARCKQAGNDWHDQLAGADPQQRAMATLQLLARLQMLYGPATVPALAERVGRDVPALVERFHSRARRDRIKAAVARTSGRGNLRDLVLLVASPAERKRDAEEFATARSEFFGIAREIAALQTGIDQRPREAAELGGRLALGAAIVLAWSATFAALFIVG